ncbi:hypothetical protein KGF57_001175 [Candida theae]|uniref:Major facilitator superfamily (MFS) profile domain-containing protein n=1 Tax=Candida theae TaxID=1198502 RepID=A0AAD5G000_9ASCO|nr:uncharacterized protein KGF57_001175 [Candida theae]KAI5963899.1 hypothetical protein KGF57_001175 [Candida theae]
MSTEKEGKYLNVSDGEQPNSQTDKVEYLVSEKNEVIDGLTGADSNLTSLEDKPKDHYVNLPESLQHMTQEELKELDRKTTRKIDLRLIPMLLFIYILNFLDRNNIANARLDGLEADLGLVGNQYQVCISILFVGYILFQVPANMILNRFGRPSIFLTVVMTVWGAISTVTGGVQNYAGLACARVFLGVAESAFFCSSLMMLSMWYDKKSLTTRNTLLFAGSPLSSAFSGLLAAGILKMRGLGGIAGWRWLFILEGGITVLTVPFAYFVLPDKPDNTKFLSQEERDIIQWKLRQDLGDVADSDAEARVTTWQGFKLAVKDEKMWMVTGQLSLLVASAGILNFFPTIVATLNFNTTLTLVLTAPPFLLAVPVSYYWSRHADKTGERTYHVLVPLICATVSFIIPVATTNFGARYFSYCIMIPGIIGAYVVIITWMPNSVPRPPAKRAVSIALMIGLSNSPYTWTAFLYPTSDGPRYIKGMSCNIAFNVAAIILVFLLRIRLKQLNKKIENGTIDWQKELGEGNDGSKISPDFRYLY